MDVLIAMGCGTGEVELSGIRYRLSMKSDIGPRSENQDCMGWILCRDGSAGGSVEDLPGGCRNDLLAMVVCDGMGGLPHGRQASGYTADKILRELSKNTFTDLVDLHIFCKSVISDIESALQMLFPGSGTTIVMAVVLDGKSAVFHLGDSRAYYSVGGKWNRTYDHAPVDEMFRDGLITEEEINTHPLKNVISKYVGGGYSSKLGFTAIEGFDRLVLCTDGAYTSMGHCEFLELISGTGTADGIVDVCVRHGTRDNTTVISLIRE